MADVENRKGLLIGDLQDKEAEIRQASAEALERLQIRLNIDRMASIVDKGETLEKIRVVYALADLRGTQIIDVLVKALADPSEDVRAATVRALGSMGDGRVLPHLAETLEDLSPIVVRSAIDALARYTDARILGPLMHKLKDKDSGVVERALEVVGRIGDKRAEEAMMYFAVKGNLKMRTIAIKALGVMDC